MPIGNDNNDNKVNINIWETFDETKEDEFDSSIRILYHKLKKQQNEAQFIRDSENYFRTGLNRPKCITEREMMMMMNF
jgi:hypothetical protein